MYTVLKEFIENKTTIRNALSGSKQTKWVNYSDMVQFYKVANKVRNMHLQKKVIIKTFWTYYMAF